MANAEKTTYTSGLAALQAQRGSCPAEPGRCRTGSDGQLPHRLARPRTLQLPGNYRPLVSYDLVLQLSSNHFLPVFLWCPGGCLIQTS